MKVILICCILSFVLFGCDSKTNEQKAALKKEQAQKTEDFMSRNHKEKVALLSFKYDIDESKVESILDEYLFKHDIFYRLKEGVRSRLKNKQVREVTSEINLDFQKTLSELSNKYNIPKNKLSDIIIDYRTWSACEDKGNSS
jgi:hypothetical protein